MISFKNIEEQTFWEKVVLAYAGVGNPECMRLADDILNGRRNRLIDPYKGLRTSPYWNAILAECSSKEYLLFLPEGGPDQLAVIVSRAFKEELNKFKRMKFLRKEAALPLKEAKQLVESITKIVEQP